MKSVLQGAIPAELFDAVLDLFNKKRTEASQDAWATAQWHLQPCLCESFGHTDEATMENYGVAVLTERIRASDTSLTANHYALHTFYLLHLYAIRNWRANTTMLGPPMLCTSFSPSRLLRSSLLPTFIPGSHPSKTPGRRFRVLLLTLATLLRYSYCSA